jgi:hypothetical protein
MSSPPSDLAIPNSFSSFLSLYRSLLSASSPPDQPFQHYYAGRSLLSSYRAQAEEKQIHSQTQETNEPTRKVKLALLDTLEGINEIESEEIGTGARLLDSSISTLNELQKAGEFDYSSLLIHSIALDGENCLAIVWSSRSEFTRSLQYLQLAQRRFFSVFSFLSRSSSDLLNSLEFSHTKTVFYLAQIYAKLRIRSLAALYCQLCLRIQLTQQAVQQGEFVKNCIGLAFYYSGMKRFGQAFHCLSACEKYVKSDYYLSSAASPSEVDCSFHHEAGDLARSWAVFYLKYFQASKAKLFNEEKQANELSNESALRLSPSKDPFEDEEDGEEIPPQEEERILLNEELNHVNIPIPDKGTKLEEINIQFSSLGLPPSPPFDLFIDHNSAINCFKNAVLWFTRAMNFFLLDGYVTDHIHLAQDLSQLYKCMAAYESDLARFSKLEKRRIDLLTDIWKQLGQAAYLEFYQQLADEIAACYASMCEAKLKLSKVDMSDGQRSVPPAAQQKINQLALKAIEFYQIWINTWFDDKKNLKFPELNQQPDYQRWFFLAHFNIARLFSRVFHEDKQVILQFLRRSLDSYRKCAELADQWASLMESSREEVAIVREMIQVLPIKMDKIAALGAFQ